MYLGMDVKKRTIQDPEGNSSECFSLAANSYVKEAIRIVKHQVGKHDLQFPTSKKTGESPFNNAKYRPELDVSDYCNEEMHTLYQNFIGMLRWMCELGRIDILHETSILSQYLAAPRMGHLTQAIHIFHYLDRHNRTWMMMDPSRFDVEWHPEKNECSPQERAIQMKEIYVDAEESIPHNIPEARGNEIDINVFVDADHAGNRVTRRSHTGIIIYGNMSPISWFSKRQNTVESSTFSSEIIALKIATEQIEALRYKLRMFGVPISGPARVFCDNRSVVISSSFPESVLKKKHCSIAYNKVRESFAAGTLLLYYENTKSNIADLLTKVLPSETRTRLIRAILN